MAESLKFVFDRIPVADQRRSPNVIQCLCVGFPCLKSIGYASGVFVFLIEFRTVQLSSSIALPGLTYRFS